MVIFTPQKRINMSKLTANFPTAAYYDTFAQWEKLMLKEG
jgi:hypothetical protein